MTIIHFAQTYAIGWNPTILGRVDADGYVVYATDVDFQVSPLDANAEDRAAIWLIETGGDTYIRVGRFTSGVGDNWYDTVGAGQGDPGAYTGTGTTVFQLGELADSVNIYNALDNSIALTPTFTAIGTYTSDDRSTFFDPTTDVKYGRRVNASASVTGIGEITETGEVTVQFTFRKSGRSDYTVTFRAHATATATVEP